MLRPIAGIIEQGAQLHPDLDRVDPDVLLREAEGACLRLHITKESAVEFAEVLLAQHISLTVTLQPLQATFDVGLFKLVEFPAWHLPSRRALWFRHNLVAEAAWASAISDADKLHAPVLRFARFAAIIRNRLVGTKAFGLQTGSIDAFLDQRAPDRGCPRFGQCPIVRGGPAIVGVPIDRELQRRRFVEHYRHCIDLRSGFRQDGGLVDSEIDMDGRFAGPVYLILKCIGAQQAGGLFERLGLDDRPVRPSSGAREVNPYLPVVTPNQPRAHRVIVDIAQTVDHADPDFPRDLVAKLGGNLAFGNQHAASLADDRIDVSLQFIGREGFVVRSAYARKIYLTFDIVQFLTGPEREVTEILRLGLVQRLISVWQREIGKRAQRGG